jgi:hypothetical protein
MFLLTPKWDTDKYQEHYVEAVTGFVKPEWISWKDYSYVQVGGKGMMSMPSIYKAKLTGSAPPGKFHVTLVAINEPRHKVGTTRLAYRKGYEIFHDITTTEGDCGSPIISGDRVMGIHYLGSDSEPNRALGINPTLKNIMMGN